MNEIISAHIAHLNLRGLRPSTVSKRQWHLTRLEQQVDPVPIELITRTHLEVFLSRPITSKSRVTELSHYRSFWRWGLSRGFFESDPTLGIESPKTPQYLPRPISEDDAMRAVELAFGPVRTWLILAGWCGFRACEIAQLSGGDIDWAEKLIRINEGKGGSPGVVSMSEFVAAELRHRTQPGWLWPAATTPSKHIAPSRVSALSNAFLHGIGIEATLHQFRHRFATMIYRETSDLLVTQNLMRHRFPDATAVYTALAPGSKRSAVESLPTPHFRQDDTPDAA